MHSSMTQRSRYTAIHSVTHTNFPFIGTERREDCLLPHLIFFFIFSANLFLILTLTYLETEGQLASLTTSKLSAGGSHTL